MKIILLLAVLTGTIQCKSHWYDLRSKFSHNVLSGFNQEPRTEDEAIKDRWEHIGSCGDDSAFQGNRYGRSGGERDIVLIFDVNGYIAGVQSVLPLDKAQDNQYFEFSSNAMYQKGWYLAKEMYFTTAYFVDPAIICTSGRSEDDFESDGTGYTLLFQNGTDSTEHNLIAAPLKEGSAEQNVNIYNYGIILKFFQLIVLWPLCFD